MEIKRYNKESDYSFSFGAFPTYELLLNKPKQVVKLILHDKLTKSEDVIKILNLAKEYRIEISYNSKLIEKLSGKNNIYIMGVFKKYTQPVTPNTNHVLLVNPSDMGNLGTIIRVMLGFGYKDLNIITPSVDYFDPKVIRASMGAIFKINISEYETIEDYMQEHKNHPYPFMLQTNNLLQDVSFKNTPHTLVFGTEASGLDDSYLYVGTPIKINQSKDIDSFNLSMAVGIACYEFSKDTLKE